MEGFLFLGIFMNINKTNMNHKINIFEELNTIKNMFHYQPGKVISEQDNVTNRQYLNEDAISDFEAKIPQETKYKFNKMDNGWQAAGTNEQKIVDALNSFTNAEYNLYNQYLALKKPEGVTSFEGIINHEMGYDNLEDVKKIADALKRLGLKGTYVEDKRTLASGGTSISFKENSFKIEKGVTPVVGPKKTTVVDPKKDRVKSNTNVKNLAPLTQDIQTSIGSNPSGKLSSQELDSILQRLGGNDASSETSQEVQTTQTFPTDANGKPDLDKILASLSPQQN